MAVIWLIRGQVFFCVACRFWLTCHISKKLWTLPIVWNTLSSASLSISKLISIFVVSNAGSSAANTPILARANCLTTTVSQRVFPVVYYCLHLIMSCQREQLASTTTRCGTIDNSSHATMERYAYFNCDSTCWCYQLVISGIQNAVVISMGSEWESLRCWSAFNQGFGNSGGESEWRIVTFNMCAIGLVHLGVASASFLGIKYTSPSLDQLYDWRVA